MILEYLGFFLASFFFVGGVSLQTKVIQHSQYLVIVPLSLTISTMNYFVVNNAADNSFWYFMASAGLGSALGVLTSVVAHDKWMEKKP